jgi:sporulation protein YlmC with PRC-barrel domain
MKPAAWIGALVAVVVLSAHAAVGQQASPTSSTQQGLQLQAKSLMGSTVRSQDGKDIGKVSNLMIDPKDGKVTSVVVTMGGRLGMGGQDLAVPWDGVQVARDQQNVVLTLQEQLPQAPTQQQQSPQGQGQPSQQQPSGSSQK